ncbi:MAG TPA: NAD(P)/FAD-dependent oxidoreductase [Anaeromyxobacteraceae bacterium]|nr:NAD(P)/FAD-dependent oxidoreductase [Anaeromyxobacteraceae bacterium]
MVVGSGIGGLSTAAILARRRGLRVLVLERHYTAGGFTHTFERAGFEWDVGVHYVGRMTGKRTGMRRIFDYVTRGQLDWAPMPDVYDRIVVGDRTFDLVAGEDRFVDGLSAAFPAERKGIQRYVAQVKACSRAVGPYFAAKVLPPRVGSLLGGLLRRGFLRHARRTTGDVIASHVRDPVLRAVLAGQCGDYGLPPGLSSFGNHALVADHYLHGAAYPVGGSSRIAATIAPVIEEAGGHVATSADVEQVLVEDGRAVGVRVAGGQVVRAPVVVSDAGWALTVNRLVPREWRTRFPALAGVGPSAAHLSLYVGLDAPAAALGLTGTNRWIYRDADLDGAFARFGTDLDAPFPVVYLSFASAKDPTFLERFPGKATLEAVTMGPYAPFARFEDSRWGHRGADYDELKEGLRRRLLDVVEAHVPSVRGHVEVAELSTPLSTRHFAGHPWGEIYGLECTPRRFEADIPIRTPLPGLFLTGADAATSGLTGALAGGALCASAILKENSMAAIRKEQP